MHNSDTFIKSGASVRSAPGSAAPSIKFSGSKTFLPFLCHVLSSGTNLSSLSAEIANSVYFVISIVDFVTI